MARYVQLGGHPPIMKELPEAEEPVFDGVEFDEFEEEVAAVSADIDFNMDYDDVSAEVLVDGRSRGVMMVSAVTYDATSAVSPYSAILGSQQEKKKEPEKTYLQLPQGKRIIILD